MAIRDETASTDRRFDGDPNWHKPLRIQHTTVHLNCPQAVSIRSGGGPVAKNDAVQRKKGAF
jgi:hypothetical protein